MNTKENILKANLKERLELLIEKDYKTFKLINIRTDILKLLDKTNNYNGLLMFDKFINEIIYLVEDNKIITNTFSKGKEYVLQNSELLELAAESFIANLIYIPDLFFANRDRFRKINPAFIESNYSKEEFIEDFKADIKRKDKKEKGIYRIYNKDKQIIYIGKSNKDLYGRLSTSIMEQFYKGDEFPTYYDCVELKTDCDVDIYELYYINTIKPLNNTSAKYNDIPRVKLPELNFGEIKRITYNFKYPDTKLKEYINEADADRELLNTNEKGGAN